VVHSVQTYSVGDLLSLSRRHHGVQPVACMCICALRARYDGCVVQFASIV